MDPGIPNVSLQFDELQEQLNNVQEDELFASIDREASCSELEEKTQNNEWGKSMGEKTRFAEFSTVEIYNIVSKSEVKHIKQCTKWAVRLFEG